jgi:hypothetical protein
VFHKYAGLLEARRSGRKRRLEGFWIIVERYEKDFCSPNKLAKFPDDIHAIREQHTYVDYHAELGR